MDYSTLSLKELNKELTRLNEKYQEIQDDCIKEGLSYSDFCDKAYDVKERLYFIEKHIRLKQEPSVDFRKNVDGDRYTIEQFQNMVKNKVLTDDDGFGYYATETGVSDIEIIPSDVLEDIYRKDFPYIIWHNK